MPHSSSLAGSSWPMLAWWFLAAMMTLPGSPGLCYPSLLHAEDPPERRVGNAPVDLSPGEHYPAGTKLRIANQNLLLTVPPGWHATVFEDSDLPFLVSDAGRSMGMMFPLPHATADEIEHELTEPLALSQGVTFIPTGALERKQSRVRRSYVGDAGVGRALAISGPSDQWVIYFLMGPEDESSNYDASLDLLADSTVFEAEADNRRPPEGL